jgi:hypothetical protein
MPTPFSLYLSYHFWMSSSSSYISRFLLSYHSKLTHHIYIFFHSPPIAASNAPLTFWRQPSIASHLIRTLSDSFDLVNLCDTCVCVCYRYSTILCNHPHYTPLQLSPPYYCMPTIPCITRSYHICLSKSVSQIIFTPYVIHSPQYNSVCCIMF